MNLTSDIIGFFEDLVENPFLLFLIILGFLTVVLVIIGLMRRAKRRSVPPIPPEGIECPRCGALLAEEDIHCEAGIWQGHCPYCESDFGIDST
jgi:hypothetical protein